MYVTICESLKDIIPFFDVRLLTDDETNIDGHFGKHHIGRTFAEVTCKIDPTITGKLTNMYANKNSKVYVVLTNSDINKSQAQLMISMFPGVDQFGSMDEFTEEDSMKELLDFFCENCHSALT